MNVRHQTDPKTQEEIANHYASGYEAERHQTHTGKLEAARSQELMKRFLPSPPAIVRDIGGGPGAHACWLAAAGYEVHLIDVVPLHVQLARQASAAQPDHPIASASVGDALALEWLDESSDAVLLFGPLYHLTSRDDRVAALREAKRVLRTDGVLMVVGISRFASTMDGLFRGFLDDPTFNQIVERDLRDGQHRNPTGNPNYFMDTFFHHPDELRAEVEEVGLSVVGVFGVEGPGWLLQNFDEYWEDEGRRERMLRVARLLETEASLIGLSAHMIIVGRKMD